MLKNIFDPLTYASNDASLTYLCGIFGSMEGTIAPAGGCSDAMTFQHLLPNMFGTFNTAILVVGALIVVYVTIVGVMNTAHEGKFMGKDWNNLWIPIRIVLGIAMLVPKASGWSLIQIIMMWVIIQGIGAADSLWNNVLLTLTNAGGNSAKITPQTTQGQQAITDLFKGLVCEQSALFNQANPYTGVKGSSASGNDNSYFCNANPNDPFCSTTGLDASRISNNNSMTQFPMGPENGSCGTLTLCDQNAACTTGTKMACAACTAMRSTFATIIPTMTTIAQSLVNFDYQYQTYYYGSQTGTTLPAGTIQPWITTYCNNNNISSCTGDSLPSPLGDSSSAPTNVVDGLYYTALKATGPNAIIFISIANGQLSSALSTVVNDPGNLPANTVSSSNPMSAAAESGWILAGSYYLILSRMNQTAQSDASPSVSVTQNTDSNETQSPEHYRDNTTMAARIMSDIINGTAGGGALNKHTSQISQPANNTTNDIGNSSTNMMAPPAVNSNPLLNLSVAGYAILLAVQIFYLILILIAVLAGISTISVFVLGTGIDSPVQNIWTYLFYFLIPLIWMLLGIMVSLGASLAVYVPMVPYIIFTMGAIGWLFSTIEAMVAAPLVALGILSPSGHHEVLGEAKPALMLLFGIFLRPSLMIFGLIAAMLMASVVIVMVNAGFGTVFTSLFDFTGATGAAGQAEGTMVAAANPLALVIILVAYVSLVLTSLNKCFAAIHMLPERVMGWIGGHGQSYGEEQAAGEIKASSEGGAKQVAGAGDTGRGGIQKGAGSGGGGKATASSGGDTPNPVGPGEGGEGPSKPPGSST